MTFNVKIGFVLRETDNSPAVTITETQSTEE